MRSRGLKSVCGSTERVESVVLYEGRRALSVVIDRTGRGIVAAFFERDLEPEALLELLTLAEGYPTPAEDAKRKIARGILQSRIASGQTPALFATEEVRAFAGDLERLAGGLDSVYADLEGTPLPPALELALASGAFADAFEAPTPGPGSAGGGWLERAQVWLDAGEPRRALALAAHAERDGEAEQLPLLRVRGWAHLYLGNPLQAAAYLGQAVELDPHELRTRLLLVLAEARCQHCAEASASLDAITEVMPSTREALTEVRASFEDAPAEACLGALAQLDARYPA